MRCEQYSQVPFHTSYSLLILAKKQQQLKEPLYNICSMHTCYLYKQNVMVSFSLIR